MPALAFSSRRGFMSAKGILRVFGVVLALCSGLVLGLALSLWLAAGLEPDQFKSAHAAQSAPQVTPTPAWPDYAAQLAWDGRWTCPDPVLDLTAYTAVGADCVEHVSFGMHLVNNNGDSR